MRRAFLALNLILLLSLVGGGVSAQSAQPSGVGEPERAAPATKLEAFSARTGTTVIRSYSNLGRISGRLGSVSVDAREFRDASNPKLAQYGVAIEVKESGRIERESTSFIDEDEIDSLLIGLDYVGKIDKSVTSLANFEATYRTRGDFALTVFNDSSGENKLVVRSGRVGSTRAFLDISALDSLKQLLLKGKDVISAAKKAPR